MARLEDELRNILLSQTSTFVPNSLLLDSSLAASSHTELKEDNSVRACDGNEDKEEQ